MIPPDMYALSAMFNSPYTRIVEHCSAAELFLLWVTPVKVTGEATFCSLQCCPVVTDEATFCSLHFCPVVATFCSVQCCLVVTDEATIC